MGRPPKGVRALGYSLDGTVRAGEAEAVRAIFTAFNAGASLRSIARALSGVTGPDVPAVPALPSFRTTLMRERNEARAREGLPERPVPPERPWNPSTVQGILRNPRYAGYSILTPRDARDGTMRRDSAARIVRDATGAPVMGTWEPLVTELVWRAAQRRLDDPARKVSKVGTHRRHLGSGLYLCGICDAPVRGHALSYRCVGHMMRTRAPIDALVIAVVKARLARPDLRDVLPHDDEPRLAAITDQITALRGRVARAQADYKSELIDGLLYREIRTDAEREITALERQRLRVSVNPAAVDILSATDPVSAFEAAELARQRAIIDTFCTVRLLPGGFLPSAEDQRASTREMERS